MKKEEIRRFLVDCLNRNSFKEDTWMIGENIVLSSNFAKLEVKVFKNKEEYMSAFRDVNLDQKTIDDGLIFIELYGNLVSLSLMTDE